VRTIGIARIVQHSPLRPSKASSARDHRSMLPDAD
jgi:hypothetical protein